MSLGQAMPKLGFFRIEQQSFYPRDPLQPASKKKRLSSKVSCSNVIFLLLDAAWVRFRAERPSISCTKVTSQVAWTATTCNFTKTNSNNKLAAATNSGKKGGREDEIDARAVRLDPLARHIE